MSWICPNCGKVLETSEPVWTWVKIQGEEAIHVPTCPECGYEVEEADECPLCGEPKRQNNPVCLGCWLTMKKGFKPIVDSLAREKVSDLEKWEAIGYVAQEMIDIHKVLERWRT